MAFFRAVVCTIPSTVCVQLGAKVIVNLTVTNDQEERDFKQQYNGKVATVIAFGVEHVGPLDHKGRWPGIYPNPNWIQIEMSDTKKVWIHAHSLVLNERHATLAVSELPAVRPHQLGSIRFYPDDVVLRQSDPTGEERKVVHIEVNNEGWLVYYLAESTAGKASRERARAKSMKEEAKAFFSPSLSMPQSERSDGTGLKLVSRGNVHHLYEAPERLSFKSNEEELAFWARDGISRRVHFGHEPNWRDEWTREEAYEIVERGDGDMVVMLPQSGVVWIGKGANKGGYMIRSLHDCFGAHRERVRALTARIKMPARTSAGRS